jgi:hypothetical protein
LSAKVIVAASPAAFFGALSARKRSPHSLQSTSGSLNPAKCPDERHTSGLIKIDASMPTMSSRLCTIKRHHSAIRLRFSSAPIGP